MPCPAHNHKPWPRSGTHVLRIEACETQCGWCGRETKAANNLRAHARCHVKNPNHANLSRITIYAGKAGRSRVSMPAETTVPQQNNDDLQTKLSNLESKMLALLSKNERLNLALQRAQIENENLRSAGTLTMTTLPAAHVCSDGLEKQTWAIDRTQQKPLERAAPSPSRRGSVGCDSESSHHVDYAIETSRRLMAVDQGPNVEPTVTNDSSRAKSRASEIHSGHDHLSPGVSEFRLSLASSLENSAEHEEPTFSLGSYLPKLEAHFMKDFACCGLRLNTLHDLLQHYEQSASSPGSHVQEMRLTPYPLTSFSHGIMPMAWSLDWTGMMDRLVFGGGSITEEDWTAIVRRYINYVYRHKTISSS